MSLTYFGAVELRQDLSEMAEALNATGSRGRAALRGILQQGAKPIYDQMIQNVSTDPSPETGALKRSIKIGAIVRSRRGLYRIRVGVFAGSEADEYAKHVEFGHGGPHPAGAHPYVRPAFDAAGDEAYAQIKQYLSTALSRLG